MVDSVLDTMEYDPETAEGIPYESGHIEGRRQHRGQLKLACSLLHLLNFAVQKAGEDYKAKIYLAYVGISPGQYLGLMTRLFPNLRVEGWDPVRLRPGLGKPKYVAPKTWQHGNSILMHQDLFRDSDTAALAKTIERRRKSGYLTLFVSDIRGDIHSKTPQARARAELDICKDMALQSRWAQEVRADWTQLKFRPPYSYIANAPDYNKDGSLNVLKYFGGRGTKIFFQVFPPLLSTETRIYVPLRNLDTERDYDIVQYENQLFFHNVKTRELIFDAEDFGSLRSSRRFDRFTRHNGVDKHGVLRIVADYARKVRGMRWNAKETAAYEPLLLDQILQVTLSADTFRGLAPASAPLGTQA